MYYVYQENSNTGEKKLLGFNLDVFGKDQLFYSLGVGKNHTSGNPNSGDAHLRNGYGGHKKRFKNEEEATAELITKPDAFNNALELLEKAGYVVVKKGIVHKSKVVVSYQMEKDKIFG